MIHSYTVHTYSIHTIVKLAMVVGLLANAGCMQPYKATLPHDLTTQLNHSLSFSQIKTSPDEHKGKLVILGGQILSAKRLTDSTELIILQLPLIKQREPSTELTQSQGRYIAYQQTFLDPATVPPGTRITLVGELSGSVTQQLDETDYLYPTLIIKQFNIWPTYSSDYRHYDQATPYWGTYPYGHPYWGPHSRFLGRYPFWYW